MIAHADGARVVEIGTATVVLASGGFAGNPALRHDFLPPVPALSTAAAGSLGDAIRLGLNNGAHLAGMSEAWWTPATTAPTGVSGGQPLHRNLVRELAYPGSVLVNMAGVRFVDEASSYNDLGKAFLRFDAAAHRYPNAQAWLVFDADFKDRYPVAGVPVQRARRAARARRAERRSWAATARRANRRSCGQLGPRSTAPCSVCAIQGRSSNQGVVDGG